MALFSYSEPSDTENDPEEREESSTESIAESPDSGTEDEELMERLKEDAWVFGWEFDEAKGVLRNSTALSRSG